jgi:hypothetical protein
MKNQFEENRFYVQKSALDTGLVKPLTIDDLPLQIDENKNKQKSKLESLIIHNVPCSKDDNFPNSWIIDLELDKKIFSSPEGFKKGEKAITFLSCTTLYILIVEMKETLKPYGEGGLISIKDKVEDSISRISIFLTMYLFDKDARFNNIEVKYKSIICFNKDDVTPTTKIDKSLETDEFVKILLGINKKREVHLFDKLSHSHKIEIFFIQNKKTSTSIMEIDLEEVFKESVDFHDYPSTEYTELSCP